MRDNIRLDFKDIELRHYNGLSVLAENTIINGLKECAK